jgi:hypothetical protein
MKMKQLLLLVLFGCLFLWGCPDPNESGIPDGKDFKDDNVKIVADNLVTDIYFYSNLTLDEFFYYFDKDNDCDADYLVKCHPNDFKVYKESSVSPGLFDILKYSGTPTLIGTHYHLEFPLSALDLSRSFEWTTYYWFFAMDGRDRMPNSKKKLLAYVR